MKKFFRITAIFLAVLFVLPRFEMPVYADCTCGREQPDWEKGLEYRTVGSSEGDVDTYATCRQCGGEFVYCARGEHMWEQTDVAYTTCTSDGYYVLKCRLCGATWKTTTDKAYGHRWGEWTVTKQPSCTEDGKETRECDECHEKESRGIPATKHSWGEWTVTKQPSCTEDGQESRECGKCHQKESRGIPATGHQWGAWTVIKAATVTEPGAEERECRKCHQKEQRAVEASGVYAKIGEFAFEVLIAKQLLQEEGLYEGTVDPTLDDAFAKALREFQKSQGENSASGELTVGTLNVLVSRYAEHYGTQIPADGLMQQFPSGLLAFAVFDSTYECNHNGTHERTSAYTGIRFARGAEDAVFLLQKELTVKLEPVHEPCRIANEDDTCACGWHAAPGYYFTTVTAGEIAAFTGNGGTSMVNYDLTDGDTDGLYTFEHFDYEDYLGDYLHWEEAPGAYSYHLELTVFNEERGEWDPVDTADVTQTIYFLSSLPTGDYFATLTAFGAGGEAVSHEAYGGFVHYCATQMPAPEHVQVLMQSVVTWQYPPIAKDVLFEVTMNAYAGGNSSHGLRVWQAVKQTSAAYADFTMELAKHGAFAPGTYFEVSVTAKDPDGIADPSKPVKSDPYPWTSWDFYRVRQPVNVRSGAGKNFPRIGGLSAGDVVASFAFETGEDGATYRRIVYGNEYGYVNAAFLEWFLPKDFTVNVDLGNGKTIVVETLADGTIDMPDFDRQIREKKNGRIGWSLEAFSSGGKTVEETDILAPGMTLMTSWVEDPAYVWVTLHDTSGYNGGTEEKVPVPIGGTLDQMPSGKDFVWTTEPEGQGIIVRETTRFTAEMTDLYSSRFIENDVTLGTYANICPAPVRKLYEEPDEESRVLGVLEKGDTVRILEAKVLSSSSWWYRVYSYRLGREGYIMQHLLDSSATASRTVHFDPAGGSCLVKSLSVKARYDRHKHEYHYRADTYPVPSRDGYVFTGWADASGKIYDRETEIAETDVYLKALWENGAPYARRVGVTTIDFESKAPYFEQPYYLKDPAFEQVPFHAAVQVLIIGESGDLYQCRYLDETVWIPKRFVMTTYRALEIEDDIRPYCTVESGYKDMGGAYGIADLWNGATVYVIGEKELSYRVLFNSADPDFKGWWPALVDSGHEFGWLKHSYTNRLVTSITEYKYHSFRNVLILDPGFGYCDTGMIEFGSYLPKTLPAAYCPGYTFVGWFTDPIGGKQVFGNRKSDSMTVYAHYEGQYEGRIYAAKKDADVYFRGTGANPYRQEGVKAGAGTVLVATETDRAAGMFRANYGGKPCWFRLEDFSEAGRKTTTHVEYKTDRYVRSDPKTSKGTKYYQVNAGETFVVVGEENGYYKVAYPEGKTGFAYVSKRHFY